MSADYFSFLGVEKTFSLSIESLEKAYFAAQRQFHPDRFVGKPEADRQHALLQSMKANDAYETLKSPLKRAAYLLQLAGIRVNSEQDTVKPSHELLMLVMELRERYEHTPQAEKPAFRQEVEALADKTLTALAAAFSGNALPEAAMLTLKLNYLQKLLNDIKL